MKLTSQTEAVLLILKKHVLNAKTNYENVPPKFFEIVKSKERMRVLNKLLKEILDYLDEE